MIYETQLYSFLGVRDVHCTHTWFLSGQSNLGSCLKDTSVTTLDLLDMGRRSVKICRACVITYSLYCITINYCLLLFFDLGREGYLVYKSSPYGPIEDLLPYLARRAQENRSIFKNQGIERTLMLQELKRKLTFR